MLFAQKYLEIVRKRGENNAELKRVYHNIRHRDLFLTAYANLYANPGATTPGIDPTDTVDGMSLERIDKIIDQLKQGEYHWKPARRTYVRKKNGQKRPISIPGWTDKMVQEVMRMVLEAYYEPRFSKQSHGFRPGRGCHTALLDIYHKWIGVKWFIEGDIKGCFDNISHDVILNIISKDIKDDRFLKLLREMLQAGYMEDWRYHETYSGTPQGGVVSPILSNIVLNELDQFITQELIPTYTKGRTRKPNPEYARLKRRIEKAKKDGNRTLYKELVKQRRQLPTGDSFDPDFRRLKYVRYADDFLLGFIGPKAEALEIKEKIGQFLQTIGLTMSTEKTFITHATADKARFLSYDIHIARDNTQFNMNQRTKPGVPKTRSINGHPILSVPPEIVRKWERKYARKGKPHHRNELIDHSDYDIVRTFDIELGGIVNYYQYAHNVSKFNSVKYYFKQSLVFTLARKFKCKSSRIYKRYTQTQEDGRKVITVTVPREEPKPPLVATFGAFPIRVRKKAIINDDIPRIYFNSRSELITRLLADKCELCGTTTNNIEHHHVRKLKDLKKRYQGRKQPPKWVQLMIAIRRKTLAVCKECHRAIHTGNYDGAKLT